jgi:hypothetical protein
MLIGPNLPWRSSSRERQGISERRQRNSPFMTAMNRVQFCSLFKVLALLACLLSGCAARSSTIATIGGAEAGREIDRSPESVRIEALTKEIRAMSPKIDPDEAARCAARAIRYTALLAETHTLTSNGEFNSLMVNLGIKRRGQCFQLADDLNAELQEQNYKTLVRTRAICYWDHPTKEHNTIVLTAPGQPFEEGLVLDPWRNPGVLRWSRVKLDVYPWIPRVVGKQPSPTPSRSGPVERDSTARRG